MNKNENLAKIAINKSLLKEFKNSENDRIVYLKDGDEFQIQIFNPYQYVIGVSFTFNSDNVDNSKMLVLKPGERVWLERYLNENRKLKFWTYKVNNSKEVKKAIEKNGIVNIFFYKEYEKNNNLFIYNTTYTYNKEWQPTNKLYDYEITCTPNTNYYQASNVSTISEPSSYNINLSSAATSATYTSTSTISDDSLDLDLDNISAASALASNTINKTIETGRIEKGKKSKQNFTNYYGDFETYWFKKETIKILPESQKQISTHDLTKKYCVNCGKKIKKEFKFCPSCGAKQD